MRHLRLTGWNCEAPDADDKTAIRARWSVADIYEYDFDSLSERQIEYRVGKRVREMLEKPTIDKVEVTIEDDD